SLLALCGLLRSLLGGLLLSLLLGSLLGGLLSSFLSYLSSILLFYWHESLCGCFFKNSTEIFLKNFLLQNFSAKNICLRIIITHKFFFNREKSFLLWIN